MRVPDTLSTQARMSSRLWNLLKHHKAPKIREIEVCLRKGADLSYVNPATHMDLLQRAVASGHLAAAEELLRRGMNPNAIHREVSAISYCWVLPDDTAAQMIRLLLAWGAHPDRCHSNASINAVSAMLGREDVIAERLCALIEAGTPCEKYFPRRRDRIERELSGMIVGPELSMWDEFQHRWQEARLFAQKPDIAHITPQLVCALSNIGLLDVLGNTALWHGNEKKLGDILAQLPPYLSQDIIETMPQLVSVIENKQPKAQIMGEKTRIEAILAGKAPFGAEK